MQKLAVQQSILIHAPREKVWQAITHPDQLVKWFVPNLPGAVMQRDAAGKLSIHMGPMVMEFAILDLAEADYKATLRGLPDQLLTATYALEEQSHGTQVTIYMTGFEALPEDAREDRLNLSSAGWEKSLKNLQAYLTDAELPFPKAFVGPNLGYWRKPGAKFAVERSIWIKASRQRVWDALTDPKQFQAWFSPGTAWQFTGTGVGAKMYVYHAETGAELYTQVLDVVEPPHHLVVRSVPEAPEISHITTYQLDEENNGTRLTLIYSGYEQQPEENRWNSMEENTFGFGMMMQNIKAFIEGESLPFPYGF